MDTFDCLPWVTHCTWNRQILGCSFVVQEVLVEHKSSNLPLAGLHQDQGQDQHKGQGLEGPVRTLTVMLHPDHSLLIRNYKY